MLTDEEIEKCREKAAASYKRHYHSTRGQMASSSDDPEMHLIWAVIAAYEAKLREQNEPVALYDGNKFYANEKSAICGCADMANLNQVFLHPAPIPEGWKELMIRTISRMRAAHVPCADIELSAEAMLAAAARSGE